MTTRCLECRQLIARGSRCRNCDVVHRGTRNEKTAWRNAVLSQDDYTCRACGHRDPTGRTLEADHIVPLSCGGDRFGAGQALCKRCHTTKTRQGGVRISGSTRSAEESAN